jgi:O-antigen/teichoic acid export membrane protein
MKSSLLQLYRPVFARLAAASGPLPRRRRLLSEGAWVFGGQAASALGLLVGTRLLTEFVPPDTFGTVNLLVGLNTLGFNLFCLPQLLTVLRFYPEAAARGETQQLRRTFAAMLRKTGALLVAAVLLIGAGVTYGTSYSYGVFLVLAALVVAEVWRTFEWNLLSAARRQGAYALWSMAESWARPLLAVLAVLVFGVRTEAVLAGYLAATAGGVLLFALLRKREAPAEAKPEERQEIRKQEIRRYALPLLPLALVAWVGGISDRYIIAAIVGVEETGVYSATYGLISRPFLMLNGVVELLLRPIYFQAVADGDRPREARILRAWMWLMALAAAAGGLLITLLRQTIADLFFGEQYRSGADLMPWIALGYAFLSVAYVGEKPSYAHKRTMWVLVIQATGAVLSVAVAIPLVHALGVLGAALAVPVYYGAQLIVALIAKQKVERLVADSGE